MISTGDKGLDKVITGLQLGDNVVWQIDSIDNYKTIVSSYVRKSLEDKRRMVYIRFAGHAPLLEDRKDITVYSLDPEAGFESFSTHLHQIISKEGDGVFYVFDCLSDLLSAWSNDLMIGNFFKITCPYLFELNTIAYFSLMRNRHSFKTVARIRDTTQLLIDVYHDKGDLYIHPLKVWNRYSPTMFLPHIRQKNQYVPIASSADTARLFSNVFKKGTKSTKRKLDYWDRLFMNAEDMVQQKNVPPERTAAVVEQLSRLVISRDDKILALAKEHLTLDEFINIKSRMIGTGFIGGKSVGMLIARNILRKEASPEIEKLIEPHDSFYIGSDVFYTYIVENAWWKERMAQRTNEGYFEAAKSLKEKLLSGQFPEEIKEQFTQMLEYFGQSPIIVRSSSLLEDGYGNAFAGKYESIFLPNQGTPEERYIKFVNAVRRIYSSTMNEDALLYRLKRGLSQMDEQMALLVQRVSGAYHRDYFYPDAAGVGISYNNFVWKKGMDAKAGMLRLVFGMGTRAVNRVEGDYARIVALGDPLLKAYGSIKDARKYSQHYVDVVNVKDNIFETIPARKLLTKNADKNIDLIAVEDREATDELRGMGIEEESRIVTFDNLLANEKFTAAMQCILKTLENAYRYPVDTEFTVNFRKNGQFQINLLQCRPMQTKGLGVKVSIPKKIQESNVVFRTDGNFLGGNINLTVDKIIYVDPKAYCSLETQSARYDIARIVGELNKQIGGNNNEGVMLLGPGRWGTTTPTLGVPVSFSEINNISVLGEIAFSGNNVMPELSYGTHFFQDLVEGGIFYVALFPENEGVLMNPDIFDKPSKLLSKQFPEYKKYEHVIRIFDMRGKNLKIMADVVDQKVVCFFVK